LLGARERRVIGVALDDLDAGILIVLTDRIDPICGHRASLQGSLACFNVLSPNAEHHDGCD
jgi:hypothetical protein